jgi:predicted nucleic acid-binding Zn ribbon protein
MSSAEHAFNANRPCPQCERGASFHIHCAICRGPLEGSTSRRTCPGDCRNFFKSERRKTRTVRCWITPADGSGKKFLRWLPERFAKAQDTGVSRPSGARRAILRKDPSRKPQRSANA